jgi:hypothetical protein
VVYATEILAVILFAWLVYIVGIVISQKRFPSISERLKRPFNKATVNLTCLIAIWSVLPAIIILYGAIEPDLALTRWMNKIFFVLWLAASGITYMLLIYLDRRIPAKPIGYKVEQDESVSKSLMVLLFAILASLVAISWIAAYV